jgi:hypothetical protein
MVIDGNNIKKSDLTKVEFRDGRFDIPRHLIEITYLTGKEIVTCNLLVVTSGRYRLVNRANANCGISRIESEVERVGEPGDVLDYTGDNTKPAIRARWIECKASPHSGGWRLYIPEELQGLALEGDKRNFLFVFTVAGFLEIWFPDTLARAASAPISELLPSRS